MKMGLLAFGEAGAQLAEYAVNKGFSAVVVNTAKLDLDKLNQVPVESRIHLQGWEGAGRNREEGKNAIITFADQIYEKSKQKLGDCDVVFVAGSCGGGTGSGGLPIGVEIVSSFKDYVGVITALPESSESVKAQMNSLECFSELSQFQQLGSIFILDNEKVKRTFKDKNRVERHRISNEEFIGNLTEIANLTKQNSYGSNFDKNDFLEIINERGCSIISKIHTPLEDIKSQDDLAKSIIDSWKNNFHPDIQSGQIVKAAILGKGPEDTMKFVNSELMFQEIGKPYDIMEAYYENKGNGNHCTFYTLLTGLAFPSNRLNEMESISKTAEDNIVIQIENARKQTFNTSVSTSKFNRSKIQSQPETLAERLSRFK